MGEYFSVCFSNKTTAKYGIAYIHVCNLAGFNILEQIKHLGWISHVRLEIDDC